MVWSRSEVDLLRQKQQHQYFVEAKILAMARVVVSAKTWKWATAQTVTSKGATPGRVDSVVSPCSGFLVEVDSVVSTCSGFLVLEAKPVTVGVCYKAEVMIA